MKKTFWSPKKAFTLFALLSLTITFHTQAQFFSISGGHEFSASVCSDGGIQQWGKIIKTTNGTTVAVNTPTAVPLPAGISFSQIDAGSGSHGLAIDCNSKVWAWGSNSSEDNGSGSINGQLGSSTLSSSATPIPVSSLGGTGQLEAVYVSGGNRSSYAITSDGHLVSWGLNSSFELGRTTTGTFDPIPNYVLKADGTPLINVVQVDAGDNTVYALDADGFVYSWGGNTDFALGRNGTNGTPSSRANKVLKADGTPLTNIITITAGDKHGLALADDGTVWSWGGNWGPGQLGYKTAQTYSGTASQVVGVNGTGVLGNVVGISAGQASSVAVLGDGSVVTWGSNCFYGPNGAANSGVLGRGSVICNSGSTTAYIPGYVLDGTGARLKNISSISDADAVYYAVSNVGDIYTWGYNLDGELGLGTNTNIASATKLTITGCRLPDPCPNPNLGPDISLCNSSQLSTITLTTQYYQSYKYKWFYLSSTGNRTEVTVTDTNIFKPTIFGKYIVEVTPAPLACSICEVGYDTVSVDQPTTNAGTFCNETNLTFSVTPPANGTYRWWKSQTGTTDSLATRANSQTVAISTLTPTVIGVDSTYSLYYEDIKVYPVTVGPSRTATTLNSQSYGFAPNTAGATMTFDVNSTITIDTTWIQFVDYYSPNGSDVATATFTITGPNNTNQSFTVTSTVLQGSPSPSGPIALPLKITLQPGKGYTFKLTSLTSVNNSSLVLGFFKPTGVSYPLASGAPIASYITFSQNTDGGMIGVGWKVSAKTSSLCGRTKVSFTKDCPCNAPSPLSITTSTGATGFCNGTVSSLVLNANPIPTTPTITPFGYLYQWYKNGTPVADPNGKQNAITINSSDGAATYTLRVGHTSLVRSKCYTEVPLTITTEEPISDNKFISGNDTVCAGTAAKTIVGNPAKGGLGNPTYQWISSSTPNGTYTTATGTSNGVSYSPGVLSQTTYFKRVVTNGVACKDDTTLTPVFVFVDQALTGGTLTSNASNNTICSGSSVSFNITAPTGGTPSAYQYQWQSSINGTTWSNIPNATSASYSPGILTASTYFRRVITSLKCTANSNQLLINVDNPVTAGTNTLTSGDQSICQTTVPATIIGSTPTGGKSPIQYSWISTPSVASITAATGKDLTFAATLPITTVIKRIVTSTGVCKKDTSNPITITIDPAITDAGTISSNNSPANICSGSAPSLTITAVVPSSSSYTYQWQTSSDNINWTNISGATSADLNPSPAINSSTYFRRIVNSTKCTATSTGFLVPVDVPVTPSSNTISSNQDICEGSTPKTLTGSIPTGGQTPYNYTWVSSETGNAPWTVAGSGQNLTFSAGLFVSTFYKRVVTSTGACKNDTSSSTVKINVDPKISNPGTITPVNPIICSGNSPVINGTPASGGTAPLSYQWQYLDGANWVNISTSTTQPGPLATAPSIDKPTQYKRIVTSLVCTAESNVAQVDTVNGMKGGVIVPSKSELCAGDIAGKIDGDATPASGGTGGVGNVTYQWQESTDGITWSDISGEIGTSYTPGALTGTNYFRRKATNGSGTCDTAYTSPITISQYEKLEPGAILSNDTSVCVGSSVTVLASLPSKGSPNKKYTWSIANAPSFVYRDTLAGSSSPNLILSNVSQTTKVKRVVSDDCGADTSANVYTVLVSPLDIPLVSILTDLNQTFCSNSDVTITASTDKAGKNRVVSWVYNGKTVTTVPDSVYVVAASDLVNGAKIKAIVTKDPSLFCTVASGESAELELKINTAVSTNSVDVATQNICVGQAASVISGSNATGTLASPGYAWQISQDEQSWVTIPNATSKDYQPAALKGIYFYRRIALSAGTCSNDTSSTHAKIVADSVVTAGILSATIDTVCKNGVSQITATLPTGGVAPYNYQWESSIDNVNFSPISGETNADITLTALSTTTYFRRVLTTATLVCPYRSNTVKITVTDPIESGTNNLSSGNQSSCGGSSFALIVGSTPVGGTSPTTYQWQQSIDGTNTWTDIANSNTQNYNPGSLTSTMYFRRIVTSTGKCQNDISNSIRLFVDSTVTAGEIIAVSSQCGIDTIIVRSKTSATGGQNGFSYSWTYKTETSTGWSSLSGSKDSLKVALKDIDNQGTITQFYFRRSALSNGGVCSATTDSVGVTICQKPTSTDTIRIGSLCINVTTTGDIISPTDKTPNKGGILQVAGNPVVSPKHGSLNINVSNSTYSYSPSLGFIGKDTVVFAICDVTTSPQQCVNKPLYITVDPFNHGPNVLNEEYSTYNNQTINGYNILSNDSDVDGDTLSLFPTTEDLDKYSIYTPQYKRYIDSVYVRPKAGVITTNKNGEFTYEPNHDVTKGVGTVTDMAIFLVCDYGTRKYCNSYSCKKDTVIFKIKPYKIFVPDGFSPNNDGVNDFFVISSEVTLKMELKVYNRWGNLVYENKDYKNDWDGKANRGLVIGDGLPDGTYYIYYNVNDEIPDSDRFKYITISR